MQRRKFIVGMGSLAAGGAAVIGSGASNAIQTERAAKVDVKGDDSAAYLQLNANDDSAFVNNNSPLSIDFSQDLNGGSGVNNDGTTEARPGFTMTNGYSDTMYIEANNPGANLDISSGGVDLQLIAVPNANSNVGSGGNLCAVFDAATPRARLTGLDDDDSRKPGTINQNHSNPNRGPAQVFGTERAGANSDPAYVELGSGNSVDVIVRVVANGASTGDLVIDDNIEIEAFSDEADTNHPGRLEPDTGGWTRSGNL